ncbi:MAG TPA: bifunctional UDP-sugar hydrolase/5'-nucleotidase [Thermoanaerobaculia bacterium]|nr:bifunctional UDP-sugar hydrolase/5'-nucleotidase [Thermoanaerobaculia bacterium]
MTLRRAFAVLGLAACLACAGRPARPATPAPAAAPATAARFTILQINDVYKIEGLEGGRIGGLARVRTLRKQLESEGRPVLLLHAGDILFPSVMSKYLRAQPMIRIMNLLDGDPAAFDANLLVTFGNHEFDDRDPGLLLGRIAESDFGWVSSNTRYRSAKSDPGKPFSARLTGMHDVVLKDVAGARLGILALTTDTQPRDYVAYEYAPAERRAAITSALDRLRAGGATAIVALTHQDLDEDERLAREFPAIGLVVGGHEHFFLQRRVGPTWITKADADAKSVVVHDVRVSPEGAISDEFRRVALGPDVEKDPAVEEEVRAWLAELAVAVKAQTGRDLQEVVGETENLLEGEEPAVRGRETALGNFLTDVIRDRMKTDLGFINGGAIRINDNIPPGPIRNYDLEGIFYFDNQVVSFEITGADLLGLLRISVAKVHTGHGRFLQVSGIRFRYHVGGTAEQPVYTVEASDVEVSPRGSSGWRPLDLTARYSVASLDYLWENGYRDGYPLFSRGQGGTSPRRLDSGALPWRALTEEAIRSLSGRRVTSKIEGRIVRVEGPASPRS